MGRVIGQTDSIELADLQFLCLFSGVLYNRFVVLFYGYKDIFLL